jgi:hypothetical protein
MPSIQPRRKRFTVSRLAARKALLTMIVLLG